MRKSSYISLFSCLYFTLNHAFGGDKLGSKDCIEYHCGINASLTSMGNVFSVEYIENAPELCCNNPFPVVHISSAQDVTAWIHIVFTDSQKDKFKKFIDSADKNLYPELYPFYTLDKDFYDAPKWNINIFFRPITYWEGHAYAVKTDKDKKIINVIGGIKWGFYFTEFGTRPKMLLPTPLSEADWKNDIEDLEFLRKYNLLPYIKFNDYYVEHDSSIELFLYINSFNNFDLGDFFNAENIL